MPLWPFSEKPYHFEVCISLLFPLMFVEQPQVGSRAGIRDILTSHRISLFDTGCIFNQTHIALRKIARCIEMKKALSISWSFDPLAPVPSKPPLALLKKFESASESFWCSVTNHQPMQLKKLQPTN